MTVDFSFSSLLVRLGLVWCLLVVLWVLFYMSQPHLYSSRIRGI